MKAVTLKLSMPRELLRRADAAAVREARSRRELIREAVRDYLERRSRWDAIFAIGERAVTHNRLTSSDVNRAVRETRCA